MDYEIVAGQFLSVTSYGALQAVSKHEVSPMRRVLTRLLAKKVSTELTDIAVSELTGLADLDEGLAVMYQLQSTAMVQASGRPRSVPLDPLAMVLPELLAPLSTEGKVVLADELGMKLAATGFDSNTAANLAVLSADIAALHTRHEATLSSILNPDGGNWGVVDVAGASRLGIWPMFIGNQRFAITLTGRPRLNQPAFADLVWVLSTRYG